MDLPWKKFWAQKNFKNYNFYFLNLSPCLLYFGAPPLLSLQAKFLGVDFCNFNIDLRQVSNVLHTVVAFHFERPQGLF